MTIPTMRSKKLFFAVFSVIMIVLTSYFVVSEEVGKAAISAIGLIASIYLGGQSGVDTMHKYKNPERE
ncbi:MAG: hypothetical protein H8D23_27600 [Candidatus Brocadiales bacterium]|nr:hypothetical protein [Candidatus Brocadiales bacterium]